MKQPSAALNCKGISLWLFVFAYKLITKIYFLSQKKVKIK